MFTFEEQKMELSSFLVYMLMIWWLFHLTWHTLNNPKPNWPMNLPWLIVVICPIALVFKWCSKGNQNPFYSHKTSRFWISLHTFTWVIVSMFLPPRLLELTHKNNESHYSYWTTWHVRCSICNYCWQTYIFSY